MLSTHTCCAAPTGACCDNCAHQTLPECPSTPAPLPGTIQFIFESPNKSPSQNGKRTIVPLFYGPVPTTQCNAHLSEAKKLLVQWCYNMWLTLYANAVPFSPSPLLPDPILNKVTSKCCLDVDSLIGIEWSQQWTRPLHRNPESRWGGYWRRCKVILASRDSLLWWNQGACCWTATGVAVSVYFANWSWAGVDQVFQAAEWTLDKVCNIDGKLTDELRREGSIPWQCHLTESSSVHSANFYSLLKTLGQILRPKSLTSLIMQDIMSSKD